MDDREVGMEASDLPDPADRCFLVSISCDQCHPAFHPSRGLSRRNHVRIKGCHSPRLPDTDALRKACEELKAPQGSPQMITGSLLQILEGAFQQGTAGPFPFPFKILHGEQGDPCAHAPTRDEDVVRRKPGLFEMVEGRHDIPPLPRTEGAWR
jgi:hypothetical protein